MPQFSTAPTDHYPGGLSAAGVGNKWFWYDVDIKVPGPYDNGVSVDHCYAYPLAEVYGYQQPSGSVVAVVQASLANTLGFLGVSPLAVSLPNLNPYPASGAGVYATMMPCYLNATNSNTVNAVWFGNSSNAAACMPQYSITYTATGASAAASPNFSPSSLKAKVVQVPASAISMMTCGDAVANSGGALAPDTCSALAGNLQDNSVLNDIGNDTVIYSLNLTAVPGLPQYVGLTMTISTAPPATVTNRWGLTPLLGGAQGGGGGRGEGRGARGGEGRGGRLARMLHLPQYTHTHTHTHTQTHPHAPGGARAAHRVMS